MKTYAVEITEGTEIEIDRFYLGLGQTDPEIARRWHVGLTKAFASLSSLPSRCAIARENEAYPTVTIRQLLYGKFRLLFYVIEPESEEETGIVRILHVVYGAQIFQRQEPDTR